MTKLLEKAMARVSRLPKPEQDAVAAIVLEELESEKRWTVAFARSKRQLAALADEAIAEFKKGKTRRL